MTDNEIIKALEYCSMQSYPACKECPYHDNYSNRDCIGLRNADIKDLINRQKAQIESLREENIILSHDADTAFQDGLNENRDLFKKEVEPEIRAEAYKEFAERLKTSNEFYDSIRVIGNIDKMDSVVNCIDNLLKEMVGE